jgi:formylglycine-generating enzyme required for sulfatase activity
MNRHPAVPLSTKKRAAQCAAAEWLICLALVLMACGPDPVQPPDANPDVVDVADTAETPDTADTAIDTPPATCDTDCSDGNPCTVDSCTVGTCTHVASAAGVSCDDGDACTTGDACATGSCIGVPKVCGTGAACDAGNCVAVGCKPAIDSEMALIPAGTFQMGCVPGDPDCQPEELPRHAVYLDAYYIDAHEVTVGEYLKCVAAGGCSEPAKSSGPSGLSGEPFDIKCNWEIPDHEQYPVNCVTWYQSDAYCKWAVGRLPTEAEWEKAARGGLDGKQFPWGDEPPTCEPGQKNSAVFWGGTATTACDTGMSWAVGTGSAPNGYCLYDMVGNVSEWVADWYDSGYYASAPVSNPHGPLNGEFPVRRGSGYRHFSGYFLRASFRGHGGFPSEQHVAMASAAPSRCL